MVENGRKLPEIPSDDEQRNLAERMNNRFKGRVLALTIV